MPDRSIVSICLLFSSICTAVKAIVSCLLPVYAVRHCYQQRPWPLIRVRTILPMPPILILNRYRYQKWWICRVIWLASYYRNVLDLALLAQTLRFLCCERKAGNRTLTAVSALPSHQSFIYIQACTCRTQRVSGWWLNVCRPRQTIDWAASGLWS